eukprot:PhF_6_TR10655/c0_g1_i1/m.17247/K10740/RPA3; replication factor A3
MMNFMKAGAPPKNGDQATSGGAGGEDHCTPRITANMISKFAGQKVVIIGKALALDPNTRDVSIEDPCSGEHFIARYRTTKSDQPELCLVNEFVLKISPDGRTSEIEQHGLLSDDFDFEAYKAVLQLIWSHASPLFNAA